MTSDRKGGFNDDFDQTIVASFCAFEQVIVKFFPAFRVSLELEQVLFILTIRETTFINNDQLEKRVDILKSSQKI